MLEKMAHKIDNQTEEEKREILKRYRHLLKTASPFLKDGDAKLIKNAFKTAADGHIEMRRKTGEPYIYHPIEVAQIVVGEINLGPTAIAAALLHDVVEDTEVTIEDIERDFGKKIAKIVDGVTKISSTDVNDFEFDRNISQQAENFRKMLLTLSDDVRVIMVKIADRLHNMRTLDSMARHKQLKIASETIYIYAPLAHRLGLYKIKSELEDLYLKYTQQEAYREIARKLNETKVKRDAFIEDFIAPLRTSIANAGFKARILGRPKSIYSIWSKMKVQNIPFEKVYDLFAIRIIIDVDYDNEKPDCWRVYSLVTDSYNPNPDRLRDWISTPRANGYESLHTTVMGPEGKWVEVQIRTERMDEIAEKGFAAHWKYKEQGKNGKGGKKGKRSDNSGLDAWLSLIRDLREKSQNGELTATEFINDFRQNFFEKEVFVFTPKGELLTLANSSTALDFAFHVHTEIGYRCLGAKVNQKLVPLNYQLKNGDQVEIITSKKQKPSADWLRFVKTSKAKAGIKDYLKGQKELTVNKGLNILKKKLADLGLNYNETIVDQIKIFLELKKSYDLPHAIGKGYITPQHINKFKGWKKKRDAEQKKLAEAPQADGLSKKKSKIETLFIGGESQIEYTLAKCCNPLPGDDVFGFITIHDGIKVHRTDCPQMVKAMAQHGDRIIRAQWQSQRESAFLAILKVKGTDRIGLVKDVTQVISGDLQVNIKSLNIGLTDEGIFEGTIKVFVYDTKHLEMLREELMQVEGIVGTKRCDAEEEV
jgi:GTP pyrophosphokinase